MRFFLAFCIGLWVASALVLPALALPLRPADAALVTEAMLPEGWDPTNLDSLCDLPEFKCENDSINLFVTEIDVAWTLSGELSCRWFELADLTNLHMLNNEGLYGDLSKCVNACASNPTSLAQVMLGNNDLNGSLPTFPLCQGIHTLELYDNELTGTIPEAMLWSSLRYLHIPNNYIHGSIPPAFFDHPFIRLSLHSNKLSGTLPPNSTNLWQALETSNNWFEGPIPSWIYDYPNWDVLRMGHNNFDCPHKADIIKLVDGNPNARIELDGLTDCDLGLDLPRQRRLGVYPFLNSKLYKDEVGTAQWSFTNARLHTELFGTRFYFFAMNGSSPYKSEYIRFEGFGLQRLDADQNLLEEFRFRNVSDPTTLAEGKFRFDVPLENGSVISLRWEFDRPDVAAKLSVDIANTNISPTDVYRLGLAWTVGSPVSVNGMDMVYTLNVSGNFIESPIFAASAELVTDEVDGYFKAKLATVSQNLRIELVFPSIYDINGQRAAARVELKGDRYTYPFGPARMQDVLDHGEWFFDADKQSYTWMFYAQFEKIGEQLTYDPDIQIGLLFGVYSPETQTPLNEALAGGAIAGIVVGAIVAVAAATSVAVIKVKIFPASARANEAPLTSTTEKPKETAPSASHSKRGSDWQNPELGRTELKNV